MCLSVVSNSPKLKKLGKCEGPQEKRLMDLGYLAGWLCLKWCTADFGLGSLGGGVPGSLDLGGCLGSQVLSYRPDQDGPLAVGLAILWDRPDGGFVCGWIKGLVLSWKIFWQQKQMRASEPPGSPGGAPAPQSIHRTPSYRRLAVRLALAALGSGISSAPAQMSREPLCPCNRLP